MSSEVSTGGLLKSRRAQRLIGFNRLEECSRKLVSAKLLSVGHDVPSFLGLAAHSGNRRSIPQCTQSWHELARNFSHSSHKDHFHGQSSHSPCRPPHPTVPQPPTRNRGPAPVKAEPPSTDRNPEESGFFDWDSGPRERADPLSSFPSLGRELVERRRGRRVGPVGDCRVHRWSEPAKNGVAISNDRRSFSPSNRPPKTACAGTNPIL